MCQKARELSKTTEALPKGLSSQIKGLLAKSKAIKALEIYEFIILKKKLRRLLARASVFFFFLNTRK